MRNEGEEDSGIGSTRDTSGNGRTSCMSFFTTLATKESEYPVIESEVVSTPIQNKTEGKTQSTYANMEGPSLLSQRSTETRNNLTSA